MEYHEAAPPAALHHLVARFWHLRVPAHAAAGQGHRVLPDGCTDLLVVARQGAPPFLTVRGPRSDPLLVPVGPGDRFWGARLWPDAGGRVLGAPAESLVGLVGPAHEHLGPMATTIAARVLAQAGPPEGADEVPIERSLEAVRALKEWLVERAAALEPPDPAVRLAVLALHATDEAPDAAMLGALVGLSARQLQRRFRAATGLTPKTYARIRRLRRSVAHLLDGTPRSWGQVAAALGFADQSHLITEFTRLAGARPAEVAAYVARIRHSGVEP